MNERMPEKERKEHSWAISKKKKLRNRRKDRHCVTVTNTNYNKRRIHRS